MQEQLLKEKERKQRTKSLIKLGALIAKAKLDSFEKEEILGALLEIKEKSEDKEMLAKWKEKGTAIFESEKEKSGQAIIIRFPEAPSTMVRKKLKDNKFRWNAWRKEWQGRGNREELEKLFENDHAQIESVED
ncbi:MAG: conjugal transfer protein TraD [Chlamydiota bacterium]